MLTKKQIQLFGVVGSVASIVSLALFFFPTEPKPQVSVSGSGSAGLADVRAGRDINIEVSVPATGGPQPVVLMSHDQFWEAIVRGDARIVERLAKEGMKLKPSYFNAYFSEYFTPETFAAMQKFGALPALGCPVSARQLSFYVAIKDVPQKVRAVRALCSTPAVLGALEEELREAAAQIAAAKESERTFESRVGSCVAEMKRTSTIAWYEEASKFNLLGGATYTLRQSILARLNGVLVMGQLSGGDVEAFLNGIILEQCQKYNVPPAPDTETLATVEQALDILRAR